MSINEFTLAVLPIWTMNKIQDRNQFYHLYNKALQWQEGHSQHLCSYENQVPEEGQCRRLLCRLGSGGYSRHCQFDEIWAKLHEICNLTKSRRKCEKSAFWWNLQENCVTTQTLRHVAHIAQCGGCGPPITRWQQTERFVSTRVFSIFHCLWKCIFAGQVTFDKSCFQVILGYIWR